MTDQQPVLISDAQVFDGTSDELRRADVLVTGSKISEVSEKPLTAPDGARRIDADGRVLMPGMSDAHWHMIFAPNTMDAMLEADTGLMYTNAVAEAESTLLRGFTTVRDVGGPTFGLKKAIDAGSVPGPRVFPSGALISQTAGHGDFSPAYAAPVTLGGRPSRFDEIGVFAVANGPAEVQAAVRAQLKRGASQIKLALGGGVISDTDPLDTLQYTSEEISAAVQTAADWGTYVCAHVYTAEGIKRAIRAGVKSIEHGHLVDEETLDEMARNNAWLSLQPFQKGDNPLTEEQIKKAEPTSHWDRVAQWAKDRGVRVAFGTDMLFQPGKLGIQSVLMTRFEKVFGAVGTLKIVTSGNAELLGLSGKRSPYGEAPLGVIREGAWADLLVVDGNPLENLSMLADPGKSLALVMKNGAVHKNTLGE